MVGESELQQFRSDGLVTINTPFSSHELAAANRAVDRLYAVENAPVDEDGWYCDDYYEPELIDILQHPFFETLSEAILSADQVEFAATAFRKTTPKPNATFKLEQEHVDFKCTTDDLTAKPVRMLCGCFLWLTDVSDNNCPLYFRPGSHWLVAEHTTRHPETNNFRYKQEPPDLDYADPIPVFAKAGQVTILSGPLVHSGSVTPGNTERRLLAVEYKAAGTDFRYYIQLEEEMKKYCYSLKGFFRRDRLHVLPS